MKPVSAKLTALETLSRALARRLSLTGVVAVALKNALAATTAEVSELFLVELDSRDSVLVDQEGPFPHAFRQITRFPPGVGYPGLVAASGEAVITQDLPQDERYLRTWVKAAGFRSYYCFPLLSPEGVVGCLNLASRSPRLPSREDGHFVQALGNLLIAAVERDRGREEAIVQERQRLAQEIHDGLAQNLGLLKVQAEVLQRLSGDHPLQGEIAEMKGLVEESLAEVRRSLWALPPPLLDQGLLPAVRRCLERYQRLYGVAIDFRPLEEGFTLPPQVEATLLRLLQEALSNAARHAAPCRIWVELGRSGRQLWLKVRDDGRGFDPRQVPPGQGLSLMAERLRALGGSLTLDSTPGAGTTLLAQLPEPGWAR